MGQLGAEDGMVMTVGVVVAGTMVAVGVEAGMAIMDGMIDQTNVFAAGREGSRSLVAAQIR